MRIFSLFLLLTYSSLCSSVGWEVLSVESAKEFGVIVEVAQSTRKDCLKVDVTLPRRMTFQDLGSAELLGARYFKIKQRTKGWQLAPRGTQIDLLINYGSGDVATFGICLDGEDIENGYLSINYLGQAGTPPMVLIVELP